MTRRHPRPILARFARERRAGTGLMFAILAPAMIGATALSIDTSVFHTKKRKLQSAVDMAALASVTNPAGGDAAARQSLTDNGIAAASVAANAGRYDASAALGARFTAGATPANAVSVTATMNTPMMLGQIFALMGRGGSQVTIAATGTAAATPTAAFAIGARLLSLDGGIANAILSGLLGARLSLSAGDYDALASASIDFDRYLQSVSAAIGGNAGTKADVLGTSIPLATAIGALAGTGLDLRTSAALQGLSNALAGNTGRVTLGGLFNLGPYAALPVAATSPVNLSMNAYDIVSGLIGLTASGRPVTISLGATIPGLTGADLTVTIGSDAPTAAVAPYATVTTAVTRQIHMSLTTSTNVVGLGSVRLPLILDLASAKATTTGPVCSGTDATLNLAVTPSAADLTIGNGTGAPGGVATILGLPISAYAHAAIAASAPTAESFTAADVAAKTVRTTATHSVTASLVSTALGNLQLSVAGAPSVLPPGSLSALSTGLAGLATPTDVLLDSIMRSLGVGIGEADTWVTDLKCGTPVLIQ